MTCFLLPFLLPPFWHWNNDPAGFAIWLPLVLLTEKGGAQNKVHHYPLPTIWRKKTKKVLIRTKAEQLQQKRWRHFPWSSIFEYFPLCCLFAALILFLFCADGWNRVCACTLMRIILTHAVTRSRKIKVTVCQVLCRRHHLRPVSSGHLSRPIRRARRVCYWSSDFGPGLLKHSAVGKPDKVLGCVCVSL